MSRASIINCCLRAGNYRQAFMLYQKTKNESVDLNQHTYVALLKACSHLKDLQMGYELHADIAKRSLDTDLVIGSTLIDMYVKCGSLAKARELFENLNSRNVVSWNALIAGYAKYGHGIQALDCFERMQLSGISPDAITFTCSLKACGITRCILKGKGIHTVIERTGLLKNDIVLGNALMDMYAKCDCLEKMQEVFDKLSLRNVVSWNVLITGYAHHDYGNEVLSCFQKMFVENVSPNLITFVSCLKACGSIGNIKKGEEVHVEVVRKELLDRELVLGSVLVDMYARCGLMNKAHEVFSGLSLRNVVSWNALIGGYIKQDRHYEAIEFFQMMELENVPPDSFTYVYCLMACSNLHDSSMGYEIHSDVVTKGLLVGDHILGSALVGLYAKCGLLQEAMYTFDHLSVRDIVSWTALITGLVEQGYSVEALNCFTDMEKEGHLPDSVTLACVLKACGNTGALDKGSEIHADIERRGLAENDSVIRNALVEMYVKFGLVFVANEVLDAFVDHDIISWNALIIGYMKYEYGDIALKCYEQMQLEGVSPNAITFSCILKACISVGTMTKGTEIHKDIERKGLLMTDCVIGNTLVDMYCKFGMLEKANQLFDKLTHTDEVSWNALAAGYSHLGDSDSVLAVLNSMGDAGYKHNTASFLSIVNACSHDGMVDKAKMYFNAMFKDNFIIPTVQLYTSFIDLLCRAGQFQKAVEMINLLPFHPDAAMWCSVLGACRNYGDSELAEYVFEQALQLDANDTVAYISVYNVYVSGK